MTRSSTRKKTRAKSQPTRNNTSARQTRHKAAVSYAEPSTESDLELGEEEDSEDDIEENNSFAPPPRQAHSLNTRSSRRSATQRSAGSAVTQNCSVRHSGTSESRRPTSQSVPIRSSARFATKRQNPFIVDEESSDNNDGSSRKRAKPATTRSTRSRKFTQSPKKSAKKPMLVTPVEYLGPKMDWPKLPFFVLKQIFEYAAHPLYDERTFHPLPSVTWLLNVARMCRDFAEPALTVLYNTPPLVPMDKAHRLVDLLKSDPATFAFGYRQKVERLQIEVCQVAAYSLPGSGHLDLHGLIKDLPRLQDLEFYHQKDMKPWKELGASVKWNYPESLFEALKHVDPAADPDQGHKTSVCNLRSWRWSSRLAGKTYPIERIREIHLMPSFLSLRKLSFVNYQLHKPKKNVDDPKWEDTVAAAIAVLPNLEHLIFEACSLLNQKLMQQLPSNLRSLEITNCREVTAEMLSNFLLEKGRQLRSLTLNHNSALSLSFLPILGDASPYLEVLKMDLQCFYAHASIHHNEPDYKCLLWPDEIPVWPSTLQVIELINLGKWDIRIAEQFFQSLLDSASILRDLRTLVLQTSMNVAWRERADFRQKWIDNFSHVFKRLSNSPKQYAKKTSEADVPEVAVPLKRKRDDGSLIDIAPSSSKLDEPEDIDQPKAKKPKHEARKVERPTRQSTRNKGATNYAESSSESEPEIEAEEPAQQSVPSDRELARHRGATREIALLKVTAGIDATPSSPPRLCDDSEDEEKRRKQVIQGMCEVVSVRIDNLRPAETQFAEEDFLDSEPEGDGDWDGDGDEEDGVAW